MSGEFHDDGEQRDRRDVPPTMSIGKVVENIGEIHSDVTRSSLRFLEREGLITSKRSAGGHRQYSRSDVDLILQIKQWQHQRFSLQEIRERLSQQRQMPSTAALANDFLKRAATGNLSAARQTILDAAEAGMPLQRLFSEILAPALSEVGERWQQGDLMVAQEKEITEIARELITELTLRHEETRSSAPVLAAACVEGEYHDLGLRMISGLLRANGFTVHFLGPDVAPEFLAESVSFHRPDAILLSATMAPRLPAVKAAIDAAIGASDSTDVPNIIVGGQIATNDPTAIRSWGAIPVSERLTQDVMETILPLITESNIVTTTRSYPH